MKDEHEIVKDTANEALDIIIPKLAEEYDLKLHKPSISVTIYDYMHATGKFIPIGEHGLIKLQQEACRMRIDCCGTVSHEMGHASIYQNCPVYKKTYDSSNTDFQLFEEGISRKFAKKGLELLKDKKYLNKIDFYAKRAWFFAFNLVIKEILFPDMYSVGEMIIDYYGKKGVSIKKLIINPEEFEKDLRKNWKSMVKPHTKPAIKLYKKIFS